MGKMFYVKMLCGEIDISSAGAQLAKMIGAHPSDLASSRSGGKSRRWEPGQEVSVTRVTFGVEGRPEYGFVAAWLESVPTLPRCARPRECGDRPATPLTQRNVISPNESKFPLATALDWH